MSTETTWLRGELLASRLGPDEALPESIRWIDLDKALLEAGGSLAPGQVSLDPKWVATLLRWRLAGLRPLVATCARPPDCDLDSAREAALEVDVLTGGTLDAVRIETARPMAPSGPGGPPQSPALRDRVPWGSSTWNGQQSERVRGALLGLAVGDALGAPIENWPAEKITRVHGAFRDYVSGRGWGPGHPTRETTFALLWLREFADGRTVHSSEDRSRLGLALARWVVGRPRDFGHLTRGVLRSYLDRPPVPAARQAWERAGRTPEFNGALSRAAAVGAVLPNDPDLRWASALAASAMSFVAPVCLSSSVAVADGVAALIRGDDPLDAARSSVWEGRTSAVLDGIVRGWEPGGVEWNGHDRGHVLRTLATAFWAARQAGGFEDVILDLIHRGGDADTHGAIAGALLGARDGPDAIPERWLVRLRVRPIVDRFLNRFGGGRQPSMRD